MNHVSRSSIVLAGVLAGATVVAQAPVEVVRVVSKAVEREGKLPIELQRAAASAKLAAAPSTYDRLKAASATPGVVAENDVVVAGKTVEAAQALVHSYESSIQAAQSQVQSVRDLQQYLTIKAPFEGI